MQKRPLPEARGGGSQQKRPRSDVVSRIFVGGLSYSTNWQGLKDHFAQIGEVEFASVLLKPDGSSKGCGMVNYRFAEDALRAVEQLNETLLDGRRIMVKLDTATDFKRPSSPSSGLLVPLPGELDLATQLLRRLAAQSKPQAGGRDRRDHARDEGVRLPPEHISRVFVGNLSFATTWQGLKDHFKTAGSVEFASVLENPDKTSKGVGLVNFATHEEAVGAVDALHETFLDGRQITVKLDVDGRFKERPPPKSQQQPEEETVFYTLPEEQISRVFVGNLSYNTNWQALKDHFAQAGEIEFASVLLNADHTSKGVGMVNFRTHEDAVHSVELLNNSMLDNRQITVKLDVDGHFKERPPPGARPRVFQRPRGEAAEASAEGGPLLQAIHTALLGGGRLNTAPVNQSSPPAGSLRSAQQTMTGLMGQSPRSPQATTVDCLAALGRLAQTPVAGQIDWPTLISSVAATVLQSAAGAGGPRHGHV